MLFGDLVAAVEYATDQETATAHAPDFKPGTNAQRHRLIHAKHGSKHGSGRLSSIFGTHAQSHRLHRAKYGSKHGSKHGSGSLAALFTSTSGSVRGSVGAPAP